MIPSPNDVIPNAINLPKLPEGFMWNVKAEYFSDRNHWSTSLALFSTPGNGAISNSLAWDRVINLRAWGHPASFAEIESAALAILEKPMVRYELGLELSDEVRKMCESVKAGTRVAGFDEPNFVSMYQKLV